MNGTTPKLCPACWTAVPPTTASCPACGQELAPLAHRRRGYPGWLIGVVSAAMGVGATVWWMRRTQEPPPPLEAPPAPAAPQDSARSTAGTDHPRRPQHTVELFDGNGRSLGRCLLLRARPNTATMAFLPLAHLPWRGDLAASDGARLEVAVHGVADAYGFVLLGGVASGGSEALLPRRAPIATGAALVVDADDTPRRVLGRSPTNANELVLDGPCPEGAVLVDTDATAAALALGGTRALAVTPVWSWLEAAQPGRPLAAVQAELRARDPAALLQDAQQELAEAATVDATRAVLARLETGFALARDAELVHAYDLTLRAAHRLLAQRLAEAGDARAAFEQARQCLTRFPSDVDVLADAIVLAAGALEFQTAADLWLELRSRDANRAREHASGLGDALMRAASDRVERNPRDAIDLLARGVELFPDRADLRMSYAGALLRGGDGASALWQARIAADRDPSLRSRLGAIEAQATSSGSTVEIPLDPDSHVVRAECAVGGRRLELMVDTGASITVLPSAYADLGKRTGRRVRIQTASGEVEAELVRFAELQVGSISVTHITAAVLDLPGTLAGKGLLGMNVLRRLNMQLDAARDVLVLRR